MRSALQVLAAEPLVHFAVLGAVVFGVERLVAPPPRARIDVTAEALAGLRVDHERRRGAPPTGEETRALVDHYLDDEVMYREALALGLDEGDIIVRRRLVQKMQLLLEGDPSDLPDDAAVTACFDAHPARYRLPATITVEHVFFQGPDAERRARAAAVAIGGGADAAALGDPFLRGRRMEHATVAAVAGSLGADVAAAATSLPVGVWLTSPIPSPHGLHLVRVLDRDDGRPARLEEVVTQLREDCARELRETRARDALTRLRARYDVHLAAP